MMERCALFLLNGHVSLGHTPLASNTNYFQDLGHDITFEQYNYQDSLHEGLIEGFDH